MERGAGVLQSVLDLGALPASRGGLLERGCALFRGKGRKSHAYVTSDVELVGYWSVRNLVAPHLRSNEQHVPRRPPDLRGPRNSRCSRRRLAAHRARVSENRGKVQVRLEPTWTFPDKQVRLKGRFRGVPRFFRTLRFCPG
ncbi:hypothetical protein GCM10023079_22790 [Streptomyces chitinivorans]